MNDILIPAWVAILSGLIIFPWLLYVTVLVFQLKQEIAVNSSNDQRVYDKMDEVENRLDKSINRLEHRLDTFLSNELGLLKDMASKK